MLVPIHFGQKYAVRNSSLPMADAASFDSRHLDGRAYY
jgi:hypothetical protein